MDFDEIYKSIVPSDISILERVDEYTLYTFYTGIDPIILSKAYHAPYRIDKFPSFGIFRANKPTTGIEYLWKDHMTGESGTIFKLIRKIEQLNSSQEVYARINEDFGLDYNIDPIKKEKIVLSVPPVVSDVKIRVTNVPLTEAGLKFWQQLDITKDRLDKYFTTQIKWYWSYEEQQCPTVVIDPTFAYRVGHYYQIYSPYAPKLYKFRNDLPENYFFGYLQLPPTGEKLDIDKSSKDVIFCDRLGYNAVSGKSETTMIPDYKMLELKERFKDIYLTLDPDEAGKRQTTKYLERYPWLKPRFLPKHKDKTDNCLAEGIENTKQVVDELLK